MLFLILAACNNGSGSSTPNTTTSSNVVATSESNNHSDQTKTSHTDAPLSAMIYGAESDGFLSPRNTSVQIVFTESVAGVNNSSLVIRYNGCSPSNLQIPSIVTESSPSSYIINLQTPLEYDRKLAVCIGDNIVDSDGNKVTNNALTFNTKYQIASIKNSLANNTVETSGRVVSVVDSRGNIYIAGSMYDVSQSKHTYYISKYDYNHNLAWPTKIFQNTKGNDIHYALNKIVLDESRNALYLIGYSYKNDSDHSVIYITGYTLDGNQNWTYEGAPDSYYEDDYSSFYQGRGATLDDKGNLYVVGTVQPDSHNRDSFIFKFSQAGSFLDRHRYYANGDNYVYANAAVKNDESTFYVVGRTQSSFNYAWEATPNDDDFEGYYVKVNFNTLDFVGSTYQFGVDHGSSGYVNPRDVAKVSLKINGMNCEYLAIGGDTNYPFSEAEGNYIYADGNIKDAFIKYKILHGDDDCNSFYSEFGTSYGNTYIDAFIAIPTTGALYMAGGTSGTLDGQHRYSKTGNYDGFVAVKDAKSHSYYTWEKEEWIQFGGSNYGYASSITSNSKGDLYIAGAQQGTHSASKYYATLLKQF